MNRWLIGLFVIVAVATVSLAVGYPEDFAMALGFFILGTLLGGISSYYLYRSIYQQGSHDNQELAKRQVVNPASIMREARMQEAQDQKYKPSQPPVQQQPIPRFKVTGLDN